MHFSFAALAPREREKPDAMMGMKDLNPEEEELGPPDEEYMGDLQEQQQEEEKPTAPDPAASSDGGPSAIPDTPAVHPMATPEHLILERRAPEEPTAPTPSPLLAQLIPQLPILRRLRTKTYVPLCVCPPPRPAWVDFTLITHVRKEGFITLTDFNKYDCKEKYHWVYGRLRAFYTRYVHAHTLKTARRAAYLQGRGTDRQQEGRRAFRGLDSAQRADVAWAWMGLTKAPPHIVRVCLKRFRRDGPTSTNSRHAWGKGVVLTWKLPGYLNAAKQAIGVEEPTALRDAVRILRASADLRSTWEDVVEHAQMCKTLAQGEDIAVCLEICPDTWNDRKELKLQVRCVIRTWDSALIIRDLAIFSFRDEEPFAARSIELEAVSDRGKNTLAGFFYCSICEKVGTVFSMTTKVPFEGFRVEPVWIQKLVQAQKLDMDVAKSLLRQCCNASRHLQQLEVIDEYLEAAAVQREQERAYRLLAKRLKPQKTYEQAQHFVRQFDFPMHRYRFLVLSGPSKVGKTAFARSLCEKGMEVLEVNCASGAEPELRAYRLCKHDVILFDEIVARQVAAQRKLFQAQSASVQLGCSATNCHAYDVFVWGKKMVLCSNNWEASLMDLSEADREWVNANSYVLSVTEPMWEE